MTRQEDIVIPKTMNDPFKDLTELVNGVIPEKYKDIIIDSHHLDVDYNPTMKQFLNLTEE